MERIMIIGCSGAGKSTLARQLGEKLNLPVVHLDRIWWKPGNWAHLEREEFDELLKAEVEKPIWIIDGNYSRTIEVRLEACDTVIYLDFNRMICLLGWIGRVIKNWGQVRTDMTEGCIEWFDPEMAKFIWEFNGKKRDRYYELLSKANHKNVYILKNRRAVRCFLETI